MSRIVIKFGGTSVADIQRIRDAAKKVASEYQQDHQIVVVVSAMAGVTNKLIVIVGIVVYIIYFI